MRLMVTAWLLLMVAHVVAVETVDFAALDFNRNIKPLLQSYCYDCHGVKKAKGDVDLQLHADTRSVQLNIDLWLEVKHMLDEKEMPPSDAKQPSVAERATLSGWLKWISDNIDPTLVPKDPGHVVLHRLSKFEFDNTYRDLLGVAPGLAKDLPDDRGGGSGFDNSADSLFAQPLFIEKLLAAANEALGQAKVEMLFSEIPKVEVPIKVQRDMAKVAIERFIARAWRRPAKRGEADSLLKLFDVNIKKKQSWESAMRQVFRQVLISPPFIYRIEDSKVSTSPYEIGHYEMANRLSYFLWSTMPDEELFRLAAEQKLQDPKVIIQQVERMLSDKKALTLGDRFASQWLGTDDLRFSGGPDTGKYKEFTERMRESMCDEPGVFFNNLIKNNGSLLDLIDSDYIYVNEDTARIYGVRGISGKDFVKVERPDSGRGGVVTMPAVLALTSNPDRTSPVQRGAWVLSRVLNAPSPPPPPNVPPLDEGKTADKGKPAKVTTLRERLEKHRSDPNCASCHIRIDPIGFSLEGYDVMGAVRTRDEHGNSLDTTGTLLTGETFSGAAELKQIIFKRKEAFMRTVIEKMLAYALGRSADKFDRPTLNELTKALAADNYRARGLILGIATCYPMRNKRNQPVTAIGVK
jgi:Protein of unknown function (DUF1592)/Protein of unknown function (DUF1588)/Protein of unknown function (DUF1585)/Protein of unknown function (DUF1595)/Protein of unknown function (DUF1587)/Planctomycete cytochrome C